MGRLNDLSLDDMRQRLERIKGRQEELSSRIRQTKLALRSLRRETAASQQAQVTIQTVAKITQEQLEFQLSDIVSAAMAAVFPDPYRLAVEFTMSRGRVQTEMNFERNDCLFSPLDASGGGPVDVAAMALRFACWAIRSPRTRNTMILDEPLKWLKGNDLPENGAMMIREISEKMGLQILMNSHDPELIQAADRVISVTQDRDGVSTVEISDGE